MALGRSVAEASLMDFDPYSSHWRENVPPNDATRGVLADDEPSRACADVRRVPDDRRLEVRCGYSEDDLIRSQYTREVGIARESAAGWKAAAIEEGFSEVTK